MLYNSISLLLSAVSIAALSVSDAHTIQETVPRDAAPPVFSPFVCFSIEFVFFPDFAGKFPSGS